VTPAVLLRLQQERLGRRQTRRHVSGSAARSLLQIISDINISLPPPLLQCVRIDARSADRPFSTEATWSAKLLKPHHPWSAVDFGILSSCMHDHLCVRKCMLVYFWPSSRSAEAQMEVAGDRVSLLPRKFETLAPGCGGGLCKTPARTGLEKPHLRIIGNDALAKPYLNRRLCHLTTLSSPDCWEVEYNHASKNREPCRRPAPLAGTWESMERGAAIISYGSGQK
jgi:hypothetical protein